MDYTVHGILQATTLEWVAFPFSRGSSQPRYQTKSPALQADSLPAELQGKPLQVSKGYTKIKSLMIDRLGHSLRLFFSSPKTQTASYLTSDFFRRSYSGRYSLERETL